jgi:hypothetical protein
MAVEKAYRCDVCGELRKPEDLTRHGIRHLDERPEDAENVDVCRDCARGRFISDLHEIAAGRGQ